MTGEPETPRLWLMCDCETTGLLRTSPHRCHYRCADTSVASMVSGVGKLELPDPADGLVLDLQLPGPGGSAGSGAHRAAGDVRTSWALASRIRQAVWSPNP